MSNSNGNVNGNPNVNINSNAVPPNPVVIAQPVAPPLVALNHKNVLNIQIRTFANSAQLIDALMGAARLNNNNWSLIQPNITQWLLTALKFGVSLNARTSDPVQRIMLPAGCNMVEVRTPGDWQPATNTFAIDIAYVPITEIRERWYNFAESFVEEFKHEFETENQKKDATELLGDALIVTNNYIEFNVYIPV